jgi:hypothetical protein
MHFGVVAVTNMMLGLVTPPYGPLLFMRRSRSPGLTAGRTCAAQAARDPRESVVQPRDSGE